MPNSLQEKLILLLEKKAVGKMPPQKKIIGKEFALDFSLQKTPYSPLTLYPHYSCYVLEIGSGWGEFTLQSAKQNPQNFYIALEKKKKRVLRCLAKQENKQVNNIRWMVMDIDWFFSGLFSANSFDKIVINFPDPWPKKRHHKHRFFQENFLQVLNSISKPNALLEFATDYYHYMEQTVQLLEQTSVWKNQHGKGIVLTQIENRPQSYFEQLKKAEGENVYFVQYRKNKN